MAFGGAIKLTGESEYKKALRDITSDMKLMSSEMKVMATSTAASGAASDADKAKKEALSKAIQEQRDRLESLRKALLESNAANGETSASSRTLQTQLNNATANLNRMETSLNAAGKETDHLGTEMDDTGKKASVFGDNLKANLASEAIIGGVKLMADGIVMIGKGLVGMVADSVKAYADYEQLVGGVDTLFKESSNTVQQYAQTAYKTAGLSANQYMETITGFSASLLQGLGGDTAKAAEIGNLAVTDMSDNANKMGTSMEMIQNAYQGFAKDNFTMLDNLKLGYGGTQEEMARLINDSGVMGEGFKATAENVKDIPFDKLIEGIHTVQTEMGITGTTAKEASETITGSFNATKASWENVLTAFGSDEVEPISNAIQALVENATNLVNNVVDLLPLIVDGIGRLIQGVVTQLPSLFTSLLPAVVGILNTLIQTLATVLPQIIPVVIQLITMLVNTLIQNLPLIIKAGMDLLIGLITGLAQAMPTLIPAIVEAVVLIVTTLLENLPLLIDAGIMLLQGIVEGIIKALPILIDKSPTIITKIIDALVQNLPKLIEMGITLLVQLAIGLVKAIPQLIGKIPEIMGALINGYKQYLGNMADVGKNLVEGLWNGISNAKNWVLDKIKGFGKDVLNGIKSFFGIKSPSTLFRDEVGKNLGLGVGVGFEDAMGDVSKQMQDSIPKSFDTGVNITNRVNSLTSSTGGRGGMMGGFDTAAIASAMKEALAGMNVMLDDEKVGQFVTNTVESQVFAR